ncbi:MAG: hypothetical protein UW22_C0055G0008 [Candidatus Gottesmanbacteria bacterium GW2011_GWB1_44_11c]|uniref:Uncharacterized protein n=1 Tax=Candidatus Gottesmanbacteria bacterium GW2011_GWB1_44_11c TaxID=1618447 RepID=A0A0G1IU28_9BACT|nr:MAG: hypothetical protein UW22_C0055G0008 [Candidatus Gottesmanbacteria bacterium GW2011_GWB1_44_11c]HCM82622.1 hypothetical protein [Patescibacteria group bacterium]
MVKIKADIFFCDNFVYRIYLSIRLYKNFTKNEFDEISTFNVEARYDVYKRTLYKKATKEFTTMYFVTHTRRVI